MVRKRRGERIVRISRFQQRGQRVLPKGIEHDSREWCEGGTVGVVE